MKILLQHRKTGLFFQHPGAWTREITAASDFRTSQKAIEHVHAECMTDVQIVAVFLGGSYVESICYSTDQRSSNRYRGRA
jgi:hypothetical protein